MRDDEEVMRRLQETLRGKSLAGEDCGPFYAAIVDENGVIVVESANSVVSS